MNVIHYIGLDVHKKTISYCIKVADGRIVQEGKLAATRSALHEWAKAQRIAWHGAMEATLFSAWIYDTLKPYAERLVMGHPARMKAITACLLYTSGMDEDAAPRLPGQIVQCLIAVGTA